MTVVVGVAVAVVVGVDVRVGVRVGVGVRVDVAVGVGLSDGVMVAVGVGVTVRVAVGVAVGVIVSVGVGVRVAVGVALTVEVTVGVAVAVGVGVAVAPSSIASDHVAFPIPVCTASKSRKRRTQPPATVVIPTLDQEQFLSPAAIVQSVDVVRLPQTSVHCCAEVGAAVEPSNLTTTLCVAETAVPK